MCTHIFQYSVNINDLLSYKKPYNMYKVFAFDKHNGISFFEAGSASISVNSFILIANAHANC